jgi:hypothetical protein
MSYEAPHYVVFSSLRHFLPHRSKYSPQQPVLRLEIAGSSPAWGMDVYLRVSKLKRNDYKIFLVSGISE